MGNIFKPVSYFMRLGLAWFWFFISFLIGCLLLPFFWKKPNLSHYIGKLFYLGAHRFWNANLILLNRENLTKHSPCIYVLNHQSNLDIHTMSNIYPKNTVLIGKKEILWMPIFGQFFYGTGHILLNRQNRSQSVAALQWVANEIVSRKVNVWIFPEGHRNHGAEKMLDFKKGAFRIAIQAQVPIVPIVHQHLSRYFDPKNFRIGSQNIYAKVLDPISTKGLTPKDCDQLMAQVRHKMEAALAEINAMPIENL